MDDPALAWWVLFNFKKRDKIITAVNLIVKKRIHKYGIKAPRSI